MNSSGSTTSCAPAAAAFSTHPAAVTMLRSTSPARDSACTAATRNGLSMNHLPLDG
jgi:hypothetical protein